MYPFNGRHYKKKIILWAVRWYCKYGISYRDLEEMAAERGLSVDHSTLHRWVIKYAPNIEKRMQWYYKRGGCGTWQVDETYIKVKGKWKYLYRAIDSRGYTLDFYLSHTRNSKAATRFLKKALRYLKSHRRPYKINTDKAGCYESTMKVLRKEGLIRSDTEHRKIKYMNNLIESDHGKLKRLIKPTLGFKTMKSAFATIKGFEVMRMFWKGQFEHYMGIYKNTSLKDRVMREVQFIEGLYDYD